MVLLYGKNKKSGGFKKNKLITIKYLFQHAFFKGTLMQI